MSFGIQVKNIYDEVQIDGVMKNFQVVSYGVSNPLTGDPFLPGYLCPVYANFSRSQIVMARNVLETYGAANNIGASSILYPNNTLNIAAYDSLRFVVLEPIDTVPPTPPGSVGLQIFDGSGLVVFSSAAKNFIVDAAITVVSQGNYTFQDVAVPVAEFGRRYYQMLLRWGYQADMEGYGITFIELSPTLVRLAIQAEPGFKFSFLTGYFQE